MEKCVLLVGPMGAGKSSLARHLTARGWSMVSAAEVLRNAANQQRAFVQDRRQLQEFGRRLLLEKGEDHLAYLMANKAVNQKLVVFEGVRPYKTALKLRQLFPNLVVIYVEAPMEMRRARLIARDKISSQLFSQYEEDPLEAQVTDVRKLADFRIENHADIQAAFDQLDQIIYHK